MINGSSFGSGAVASRVTHSAIEFGIAGLIALCFGGTANCFDTAPATRHGSQFTKLISNQRGQEHLDYVTVLKISADDKLKFFRLLRSSLEGFAQCNRIWHRWLNRTLLWWHRKLLRHGSGWINTFDVCDAFLNTTQLFAPTREELEMHQKKL